MTYAVVASDRSPEQRAPASQPAGLPLPQALLLPFAATMGLVALAFIAVKQKPILVRSLVAAACALIAWEAILYFWARQRGRSLGLEVSLRKQHYVQACAQGTVLVYWGYYWRPVYDSASLIAAQLLFAYAFDMLLTWSRRDTYTLGFGPFPVVFSINLFLWFKPDWFYLQFLLVALGFAAKGSIQWDKDGRRAHIFNPSSFPLAVFSLGLILTGKSDLTWGQDIASTQFHPPHMYLVLFLIGLPGQFLFGVTTMTMSAVMTTYIFGLLYYAATGIYFFYDSYIPIAVFLGMHLLFTDPSTSPRSELGRIVFGALYGLSTVGLYEALGAAGLPTFYDKLLQVPLLNLSIKIIDWMASSRFLRVLDLTAIGRQLAARQRRLAYISIWTIVFSAMTAAGGVGDEHPGQWLPFWQHACEQERRYACPYLENLESSFCDRGSGWACDELGVAEARRGLDRDSALEWLLRGCSLGFVPACLNGNQVVSGGLLEAKPPTLDDFPIILKGSKGPIADRAPDALYRLACRQGWPETCDRTGPIAER